METDKLLEQHKKLFLLTALVLAAFAAWHFIYVNQAITEYGATFLKDNYIFMCFGAIALSALAGITLLCTKYRFEYIWFVLALMLGILSTRVAPGLSAPDEPVHYISSYYLSNQLMFKTPADDAGNVIIRECDKALEGDGTSGILGVVLTEDTYEETEFWKENHTKNKETTVSDIPRQISSPLVYLPQAIGITIARLLNFDSTLLLNLGKFFNLLFYAFIIVIAMKIIPFGKEVMAAVSFIPMTVQLSASFSYDAMLIAMSFLFIAYCLHLAYVKEKISWKDIAVLAVILAIMSPCKMVYGILVLLLLIIPKEKYSSGLQRILIWVICVLCVIVPVLLINMKAISMFAASESVKLEGTTAENYTIYYCLHNRVKTIRLAIETIMTQFGYYFDTLFGTYSGNADCSLDTPFILSMFISVLLALTGLKQGTDDIKLRRKDRIVILILSILLFAALLGSMLIGWTPLDSTYIRGIQGRYFIPILPLILLAIKNDTLKFDKNYYGILLYMLVSADAAIFMREYAMVCLQW